jgi:hypothetical protein
VEPSSKLNRECGSAGERLKLAYIQSFEAYLGVAFNPIQEPGSSILLFLTSATSDLGLISA